MRCFTITWPGFTVFNMTIITYPNTDMLLEQQAYILLHLSLLNSNR